jgi:hypothetical protein
MGALLRVLEWVCVGIGVVGGIVLAVNADWADWLGVVVVAGLPAAWYWRDLTSRPKVGR